MELGLYIYSYFAIGCMFCFWCLMEDGPSRAVVGLFLWPLIIMKHLYRGVIEEILR